ncbi:MAG: ComF family protein [Acidobacteria bacterium]|nr:ComF family protein [Acidobacteriota bacterium]
MRRGLDALLNLFYPGDCFLCGTAVTRTREQSVCRLCWEKVLSLDIRPPWCACCGLPFQMELPAEEHLCGRCTVEMPPYAAARSFGYYTAEISRMIQGFKFERRRNLAALLAPLLAAAFGSTWSRTDFDLVVPLPLHPRRRRERGFNQSALLASRLSMYLIIPCSEGALTRVRHTPPQVGLADAERSLNIRGAFTCGRRELVADRRILLVDDVMTTGATAASATEALRKAGAVSVAVLTVARTVPGM